MHALKWIDDRFWGEVKNNRVQWLGYDSGIKPASTAVTVGGCTAARRGTSGRWQCRVLRAAEGKHQPICEAVSVVALKFPWSRKDGHDDDPYWDFFIKTPPADLTNTVTELIRNAPAGNIFPTPADIHTPEIGTARQRSGALLRRRTGGYCQVGDQQR